jgi:hypothetical protein
MYHSPSKSVDAFHIQYQHHYEWGRRTGRPLQREYFLIYFSSPSALLRQKSLTSDKVQRPERNVIMVAWFHKIVPRSDEI